MFSESSSERDKNDFMNELNILKKVGQHPNVVCLVGACHIQGFYFSPTAFSLRKCCFWKTFTELNIMM